MIQDRGLRRVGHVLVLFDDAKAVQECCCIVPNGVWCSSFRLSIKRKRDPELAVQRIGIVTLDIKAAALIGPSGPKVPIMTCPPGLTAMATL